MENGKKTWIINIFSINKTVIILTLSMMLLTLSFYNNYFEIADITTFKKWQNDSESLVIGRLIKSRQAGLKADYGLLQRDPDWRGGDKFISGEHVDDFFVYASQIGLQGLFFGVIDKVISLNGNDTLKILYFINSLILAALIVLVAFWASKQFNLLSGIFIIMGCIFSPWLIFSAKNLYWVLWTMLLPFITILYLQWLEQKSVKVNQWIFALASFITVFIRMACGFEFVSSILISIEMPVIFYAISEKWNIKRYLYRSIFIGVGGLLAFIIAFCINIWQRVMYFGDFNTAWENMLYNISKRTGAFNVDVASVYQNSLEQPVLKVINTYLRSGSPLVLDYRMADLILFLFILTLGLLISQKYIPSIEEERNKLAPLAIITYISFLAPISWMILAKGHTFIHTHINYILWYFPCILLIFALFGAVVSLVFRDVWNKQNLNFLKKLFIAMCAILFFTWPVYRYYQAWDWRQNIIQVEHALNDGISLYKNKSFELVYYNNAIFYKASKKADVFSRFFLHIIPASLDNLPSGYIKHGFDNRDFNFTASKVRLPFWKTYYVARVNLPDYKIVRIKSGQFSGSTRFWEISVALSEVD